MSTITKRWLSPELQGQLTGMQVDINVLKLGITGANKDIAGLTGAVSAIEVKTAGLSGAYNNIAGLTGAVSALEVKTAGLSGAYNDITGLTGAVSSLELRCTGIGRDIAGLTGAVYNIENYVYHLQAINVGFSPITGAGSTNVQGAIASLVRYVDASVTGVNYGSGVTGAKGETGIIGVKGDTGAAGIRGATGYGAGNISHSSLTGMPDISGSVSDHDVRLVAKVQGTTPTIPLPFTGMLWLDTSASVSMGVTGPQGQTGLKGITGSVGLTGSQGNTGSQGSTGIFGSFLYGIKSGATQIAAGASIGEIWRTIGHSTLPDNVLMIGV
jgi:collagen type VII alpha